MGGEGGDEEEKLLTTTIKQLSAMGRGRNFYRHEHETST